ncbi:MAG: hypothetical protein DRQ99_29590 [Candidatus Parabeggiatoa sp. nov. 3]|nr:MAG: hypothetical protein DRQ99_29590 [Gammaproteobacteria bacterium]
MECKIYFAFFWSAKFILRFFGVQNLFCVGVGVQNGRIPKKRVILQNKFGTKKTPQNKFCTPRHRKFNSGTC